MVRSLHSVDILVDSLSYLDAHCLTLVAPTKSTNDPLADTVAKALVIDSAATGRVAHEDVDVLDVVGDGHGLLWRLAVWLWVC